MPEGDTIHTLAARLRPVLVGSELRSLRVPEGSGPPPRPGATIEAIDARGKYLRIRFAGRIELHVHLHMNGRWLLGTVDDPPRYPPHLARVVLETASHVAVCLRAPTVRLVRVAADEDATPPDLAHLGPDLCDPDADLDAALARLTTHASPDAEVGDVLLDQRVMAGIGNVFKSEVCFACGVDPFRALGTVDDALRARLVRTAAMQLRANVRPGRRRTVPVGLAVYGRERGTCVRCGGTIRAARQGADSRVTYWCPGCQH